MSLELEEHVIDTLPAFVLDALTADEKDKVAEHLATCPVCLAEFTRLQQVADELPLAVMQTMPPPVIKENLMRAIHSSQIKSPGATDQLPFWERLRNILRVQLPAYGLALIVLLVLGNLLLWRQVNLTGRTTSTPMRVIALANTQNSAKAIGTLVMDPEGKYGTLVVDNLPVLDPAKQYQIWLLKGTERTSGGVFSVNSEGYASLEIIAALPLVSYDAIGVTIEPYGGSPGPTGAKVLGGDIVQ